MLDIIIPAYNAHDTIVETIASIVYQKYSFDIHIYIVNDCSDKNYSDIVEFYKNFVDIKELTLTTNRGPGYARQYGIDNSNSDYIIFIDSDDVFSSPNVIQFLKEGIVSSDSDLLISDFVEERDNMFFLKQDDKIWLHGKIYKRKFIEENNIRFNDTRVNEDNGFNSLITLCNSKISYIPVKTYIWKNNKNSITRKNNYEYMFTGIDGYIYNMTWAIEEAIKRNCDVNKISEFSFSVLLSIYLMYLENIENKDCSFMIKNSKAIYDIYKSNKLGKDKEKQLINEYLDFYFLENDKNIIVDSIISFSEFLKRVEEEII